MFSPNRPQSNAHQCIYCGAILKRGAQYCGQCGSLIPRREDLWQEDRDRKLSYIVWPGIAGMTGTVGAYLAYTASQLEESSNSVAFATLFPLLVCGLCVFGSLVLNVIARVVKR